MKFDPYTTEMTSKVQKETAHTFAEAYLIPVIQGIAETMGVEPHKVPPEYVLTYFLWLKR